MSEKLYTIPINDAVNAGDECPFCYIERAIERDMMDFVLGGGSSYMESDVREKTDKAGFCRMHYKKMFDYGNTLGNAWIMKTHMLKTCNDAKKAIAGYHTTPNGVLSVMKKDKSDSINSVTKWVREREESCFICAGFKDHYDRYLKTFFEMYEKDEQFADKLKHSKGFCLPHFADILDYSAHHLSERKQQEFADVFLPLMSESLERLYGDVSWLIEKFDYKNKDADWKNSKEALQNCMQKLEGGYPADSAYTAKK
ncbi:MAG: hypothetical protein KBT19_00745 [Lachnospiraceae bacterium]|nr:hypothetical protein [Candidatus Colinaster equi]